jgi:trimethylamine--corrinoid protein Co-methyltransferase
MAKRLVKGITTRNVPMAIDIIQSYFEKSELLSHPSTLRWYSEEHYMPSTAIDRNIGGAKTKGKDITAKQRAVQICDGFLDNDDFKPIEQSVKNKLCYIMEKDAENHNAILPSLP